MVKILTIDDSLFERNVITNLDIIESNHGDDGLRICELEKPDLVLLNLRMPGMSWMDVLKEKTMEDCLKSGALGYISKPVTEDKLIPEVERVLNSM